MKTLLYTKAFATKTCLFFYQVCSVLPPPFRDTSQHSSENSLNRNPCMQHLQNTRNSDLLKDKSEKSETHLYLLEYYNYSAETCWKTRQQTLKMQGKGNCIEVNHLSCIFCASHFQEKPDGVIWAVCAIQSWMMQTKFLQIALQESNLDIYKCKLFDQSSFNVLSWKCIWLKSVIWTAEVDNDTWNMWLITFLHEGHIDTYMLISRPWKLWCSESWDDALNQRFRSFSMGMQQLQLWKRWN